MLNFKSLFSIILLTHFSTAFSTGPTVLSSNLTVDNNGNITVKPDMIGHYNVNNQTGIAEGNKKSFWYSNYRLEVKKNNGSIEKMFEMYPRATVMEPAMGKGSVVRDIMITNQNFKGGQLSEVLMCAQSEERSTFLLGSIESPLKKNSFDCFMATKSMCEKMRDTIRHLNNGKGPKSLKELATKVKDCNENILTNAVIALEEIDHSIENSPYFPKMLDESKAELVKKYGNKGFSLGKPEVNFKQGKQAYENLLMGGGQIFQSVGYYAEICEKFLPGQEGSLEKTESVKAGTISK